MHTLQKGTVRGYLRLRQPATEIAASAFSRVGAGICTNNSKNEVSAKLCMPALSSQLAGLQHFAVFYSLVQLDQDCFIYLLGVIVLYLNTSDKKLNYEDLVSIENLSSLVSIQLN